MNLDPGLPHPLDLRRVLVLAEPPTPRLGLIPEAWFTPQPGRHLVGAFRIPSSRRVAVAVDPAMEPGTFQLEDALTGQVVRAGKIGGGLPR